MVFFIISQNIDGEFSYFCSFYSRNDNLKTKTVVNMYREYIMGILEWKVLI